MKKHNVFIVLISLIVALGGFLLVGQCIFQGAVPFLQECIWIRKCSLLLVSLFLPSFLALWGEILSVGFWLIFLAVSRLIMTAVLFTFCALATS